MMHITAIGRKLLEMHDGARIEDQLRFAALLPTTSARTADTMRRAADMIESIRGLVDRAEDRP